MAGKKGKKDPEKKAALQAKKEAKADKAALKRLKKEAAQAYGGKVNEQAGAGGGATDHAAASSAPTSSDDLDGWLRHYSRLDQVDKVVIEDIDGFPPPRANATLTLYEESSSKKGGKQKKELYLFGGEYFDGVSSVVVNHLLRLTIDSSSSTSAAEAKCKWKHIHTPKSPPPRCAHSTVYYNHALYVLGGEISAGDAYHHYRDCWKLDLSTLEWTEIAGAKKGTATSAVPSPRSGHSAVVWKHYMIVFGGFFESSRSAGGGGGGKDGSAAKWFNDVYVLDLQSEVWLESVLSHSKLSQRPDKRSACNVCVVNDDLIVHGGFSKLERKSTTLLPPTGSSALESGGGRSSSSAVVVVPSTVAETKVHTDAWKLPLKPLVVQGKLTWERVTWSSSRASSTNPSPALGPCGRSGCGSVGYKDRLLVFGGVIDAEQLHHKVDSVFYNDLHALDLVKRKWYPIRFRNAAAAASASAEEKAGEKETSKLETAGDSDEERTVESDDGDDDASPSEQNLPQVGWDLTKLRSNMSAFLDGDGNVTYENLNDEKKAAPEDDDDDDSEVEESKDERHENDKRGRKKSIASVTPAAVKVNPQTQIPELMECTEPLPRINARLVMVGHVLHVYGGLVEVGDREVTLDDLWVFDLKKGRQWECLFRGTMHLQKWRGALHDDDDSYVSGGAGNDPEEADDSDSENDEEVEEEKDGRGEAARSASRKSVRKQATAEESQSAADPDSFPSALQGESLTDYYKRTAGHWTKEATHLAASTGAGWSDKELKREAFRLAQERLGVRQATTEIGGLSLGDSSKRP